MKRIFVISSDDVYIFRSMEFSKQSDLPFLNQIIQKQKKNLLKQKYGVNIYS